jgi:aminoglycoside phosphotransferase (APT) family kinase protein
MSRPWVAEHELGIERARRLIQSQFPALTPVTIEPLGAGWDNTAFLVNGGYVFRFPRRPIAVQCLEAEMRVLPMLAARLRLPIPAPIFQGQPAEGFPWPFAGYRFLPGRTACKVALNEAERLTAAEPIAHFLAALHAIPVDEAERAGAGHDLVDRLNLTARLPRLWQLFETVGKLGLVPDWDDWAGLLKDATPFAARRTLVHGDFYVRHLLVDDDHKVSGVIDWGDVHLGHPGLDLSIVHGFLPPSAHDTFLRIYGPIDADTWRLARFRAFEYVMHLLRFGHETGDVDLVREARNTLHDLRAQDAAPLEKDKRHVTLGGETVP